MSKEQMDNKLIDKTIQQRKMILENANEKAVKIKARADAEIERINTMTNLAIQNVIGGELRAVHDRIVGGAELQGRKIVMEARMEVISKVFEKAQDEIMGVVESSDYQGYLVKLASESINKLGEDCIVYANKEDTKHLKSVMENLPTGHKVKIEESPVDIIGGITVVNMKGTKTIHNTLDSRLKAAKNRLTAEVAEKLGVI